MSTVLCIIKSETKLQASNEGATRVTDDKATIINPCKPWKE